MGFLDTLDFRTKNFNAKTGGNNATIVYGGHEVNYIPRNWINCDLESQFELFIWKKFTTLFGIRSTEVVTWEKIDTDFYKCYLENGSIIFYDVHDNFWRELTQEEAAFKNESEWCKEFSRRLIRIMNIREMNQYDLSRITGCSQSSISNYISGKRVPSSYTSYQMAKALNCSLNYLVHF